MVQSDWNEQQREDSHHHNWWSFSCSVLAYFHGISILSLWIPMDLYELYFFLNIFMGDLFHFFW